MTLPGKFKVFIPAVFKTLGFLFPEMKLVMLNKEESLRPFEHN